MNRRLSLEPRFLHGTRSRGLRRFGLGRLGELVHARPCRGCTLGIRAGWEFLHARPLDCGTVPVGSEGSVYKGSLAVSPRPAEIQGALPCYTCKAARGVSSGTTTPGNAHFMGHNDPGTPTLAQPRSLNRPRCRHRLGRREGRLACKQNGPPDNCCQVGHF